MPVLFSGEAPSTGPVILNSKAIVSKEANIFTILILTTFYPLSLFFFIVLISCIIFIIIVHPECLSIEISYYLNYQIFIPSFRYTNFPDILTV